MKNKLYLIISVLLSSSLINQAQTSFFNPFRNDQNLHVNFKQPMPPEAAMLWKFSNVPVDYHNGLANLSIPLYEVQAKGYTLPISLSYFSSGIKVSELGPWTGCGWNLAAGGGVTREYHGAENKAIDPEGCLRYSNIGNKVKDVFDNYFTTNLQEDDNEYKYRDLESDDNEPDRFTISLPGINASFSLLDSDLPVFETKQDIKVSYDYNLNGWIIIAPDGTKYICTDRDGSQSITSSTMPNSYTSNWKVSKIITALADTISFTYNKECNIRYDLPMAHQVRYWGANEGAEPTYMRCIQVTKDYKDDAIRSFTTIYFYSHLLTNIHVASTKSDIIFDDTLQRYDCDTVYKGYALKNIQVKNMNNALVKNINFSYTYLTHLAPYGFLKYPTTNNKNYRLLLDSLTINNSEKYQFTYNPGIDGLPPTDSHAQDENGFYNGENSNNTFCHKLIERKNVDKTNIYLNEPPKCDRTTHSNYAIAGLLKSVQYPTGGKTDFSYTYGGVPGAFLINTIADSGGQIRKYSYSNHDASFTTEADIIRPVIYQMCECTSQIYCPDETYSDGLYIASSYITRCMTDHPEFDDVTESVYSGNNLMSTSKYYYYNDDDIIQRWTYGSSSDAYKVVESTKWKRNLLNKVEIRDKNDLLTKVETWDYLFDNNGRENYYDEIIPISSKPARIDSINAIRLFPLYPIDYGNSGLSGPARYYFPVVPYTIKTHYYDLKEKYTDIYSISSSGVVDKTKIVESFTFYTYTPKNTLPSSNSTSELYKGSKYWGDYESLEDDDKDLKVKYRYPTDFDTTTVVSSPIKSLLRRNMKDRIIEQQDWRYDKIVASQFYQYNDDGTLKYLYKAKLANPMLATDFKGLDTNGNLKTGTCYEIETTYDYDINHNLFQRKDRNGLTTSYLWGYNQSYPVAKVEKATHAQIESCLTSNEIKGINAGTYNDADMQTTLNKIRTQLTNALVTTYTYKPLVGIVSATDSRGVVTKYDYDVNGRLITRKDNSDKLLQSIEYNYQH